MSNAGDDILENYDLKRTLDESKEQQALITQNLKEAKNTMDQIDKIREQFEPVAIRVARLFFVLTDL